MRVTENGCSGFDEEKLPLPAVLKDTYRLEWYRWGACLLCRGCCARAAPGPQGLGRQVGRFNFNEHRLRTSGAEPAAPPPFVAPVASSSPPSPRAASAGTTWMPCAA